MEALKNDLNKSEFDAYIIEIGILLEEIRFTMKHLKKWAKPRKVKSSLAQIGSKSNDLSRTLWCDIDYFTLELSVSISDRTSINWGHCSWKLCGIKT